MQRCPAHVDGVPPHASGPLHVPAMPPLLQQPAGWFAPMQPMALKQATMLAA